MGRGTLGVHRAEHDIEHAWETRERVVVALTGGPEGEELIRRAARVARGLTEAMGGTLDAEDTPGGGLTMVLSLRVAT